jgi:uncharacterized membrane protein
MAASLISLAASLAFPSAPLMVIATYSAGSVIMILGLLVAFRKTLPRARGLEKAICLGPVLFAVPLAVFGAEHLTALPTFAEMVPRWIPWHWFWALFVGLALIAAALSIAVQRVAALASALLGFMFGCFVLLMDIPGLAGTPHNRFAWTLMLRELAFGCCAFALASTMAPPSWRRIGMRTAMVARYLVGATVIFYGVEHFLHPEFVPVIPLEMHMPTWILFHRLWAYGVGASLIAAGAAMLENWHARQATALLGCIICFVVAVVYLPILGAHPGDIAVAMNYFADTLFFGGAILVLAGSMPPQRQRPRLTDSKGGRRRQPEPLAAARTRGPSVVLKG